MCIQGPHAVISSNGTVAGELRRIFEKNIDFDSVNSDFSISFLILIKIDPTLSYLKQKYII